jgi:hypothetical protein
VFTSRSQLKLPNLFKNEKYFDFFVKFGINITEIKELYEYKINYELKGYYMFNGIKNKYFFNEELLIKKNKFANDGNFIEKNIWIKVNRYLECLNFTKEVNDGYIQNTQTKSLIISFQKHQNNLYLFLREYCKDDGNNISKWAPSDFQLKFTDDKIYFSISYFIWHNFEFKILNYNKEKILNKDEL